MTTRALVPGWDWLSVLSRLPLSGVHRRARLVLRLTTALVYALGWGLWLALGAHTSLLKTWKAVIVLSVQVMAAARVRARA